MNIEYNTENDLNAAEFIEVLKSSGLAERRPIGMPKSEACFYLDDLVSLK